MHIQFGYEKLRIIETLQQGNKHTFNEFIKRLVDIRNIEHYVHDYRTPDIINIFQL